MQRTVVIEFKDSFPEKTLRKIRVLGYRYISEIPDLKQLLTNNGVLGMHPYFIAHPDERHDIFKLTPDHRAFVAVMDYFAGKDTYNTYLENLRKSQYIHTITEGDFRPRRLKSDKDAPLSTTASQAVENNFVW